MSTKNLKFSDSEVLFNQKWVSEWHWPGNFNFFYIFISYLKQIGHFSFLSKVFMSKMWLSNSLMCFGDKPYMKEGFMHQPLQDVFHFYFRL